MDNPYQAPEADPSRDRPGLRPSTARPTAATVAAIAGLIYGGLGLICNPVIGGGNLMSFFVDVPQADDEITRLGMSPIYRGGLVAFSGVGFLTAALLVGSAAGLLRDRPWGRTLGLAYVATSLAALVGNLVFASVTFLGPLLAAAGQAAAPQEKGRLIGGAVGGGGVLLLSAIFPVVYLAVLNLKPVLAAYRRAPVAADEFA